MPRRVREVSCQKETPMIREHDSVELASDLPKIGLKAGDVGTVAFIPGWRLSSSWRIRNR